MSSLPDRFHAKYQRGAADDCWLWTATTNHRYGLISHGGKMLKAHRVSYELHHGSIPPGMVVMHTCDTPLCVNPDHLMLGTQGENCRDRDSKGRHRPRNAKGDANSMHKLTEEQARAVLRMRARGVRVKHLAEMFGVTHGCISSITGGRTWKHINRENIHEF